MKVNLKLDNFQTVDDDMYILSSLILIKEFLFNNKLNNNLVNVMFSVLDYFPYLANDKDGYTMVELLKISQIVEDLAFNSHSPYATIDGACRFISTNYSYKMYNLFNKNIPDLDVEFNVFLIDDCL